MRADSRLHLTMLAAGALWLALLNVGLTLLLARIDAQRMASVVAALVRAAAAILGVLLVSPGVAVALGVLAGGPVVCLALILAAVRARAGTQSLGGVVHHG